MTTGNDFVTAVMDKLLPSIETEQRIVKTTNKLRDALCKRFIKICPQRLLSGGYEISLHLSCRDQVLGPQHSTRSFDVRVIAQVFDKYKPGIILSTRDISTATFDISQDYKTKQIVIYRQGSGGKHGYVTIPEACRLLEDMESIIL